MDICIFGDSIAWGDVDSEKGGWVERLRMYLYKRESNTYVYNLSIPGNTSSDLLERITVETAARTPQLIVIAIGMNDASYVKTEENFRVAIETFKKNLASITEICRRHTKNIVFIGLTHVDESKTLPRPNDRMIFFKNSNIDTYDNAIKGFAAVIGLDYVGLKEIVTICDVADGLHPNAEAHEKIFLRIKEAIEQYL